jgi:hypothetical protein
LAAGSGGSGGISGGIHPAVTCSGYGCDNKDPVNTGCSADSYLANDGEIGAINVITGKYQQTGEVYNWYSVSCGTNWSQVEGVGIFIPTGKTVWVCRSSPYYCSSYYGGTSQYIYSNQVYAPTVPATAWGMMDDPYSDSGFSGGSATA